MIATLFTAALFLSAIALLLSVIRADRGCEDGSGFHHLAGESANPHGKGPSLPKDLEE